MPLADHFLQLDVGAASAAGNDFADLQGLLWPRCAAIDRWAPCGIAFVSSAQVVVLRAFCGLVSTRGLDTLTGRHNQRLWPWTAY